jgi:hypothetical protein
MSVAMSVVNVSVPVAVAMPVIVGQGGCAAKQEQAGDSQSCDQGFHGQVLS